MGWLAVAFLATAPLYSIAGFGGGSTYSALLVLSGVDYRILPSISLTCNIIVVSAGVMQFLRAGHIRLRDVAPLVLLSAPAAWLGGAINVPQPAFIGLLGASLLAASFFMIVDTREPKLRGDGARPVVSPISIGGGIGLLSGLVGIGGGIFLAPFLHFIRWGRAHEIAGASSFFILVNSLAGLGGQLTKLGRLGQLSMLADYWPLPVAVLIGGAIGGYIGARRVGSGAIKKVTTVLIFIVAMRLLWKLAAG